MVPTVGKVRGGGFELDLRLPDGHELRVLEEAARKGDLAARLALGRRYASGDGVKKSEARAFAYFESIANQYPDIDPLEPRAAYISEAFRHLASLYRKGIPTLNLPPNPAQANGLLQHSASYFGDPVSQFELARIMLEGEESARNTRIAVGWLLNACRKGFAPAQAMLGDMLWRGDRVKQAPGDGLGLMAVARENASEADAGWISALFLAAREKASDESLALAEKFIEQHGGFLRKPAMLAKPITPAMLLAIDPNASSSFAASEDGDKPGADPLKNATDGPERRSGQVDGSNRGTVDADVLAIPVSAGQGEEDAGARTEKAVLAQAAPSDGQEPPLAKTSREPR